MKKLPTLTQIAKGLAKFQRYRSGELWYQLELKDGDDVHWLDFPILLSDAGDGDFLLSMRGIEVQRWARKHVELLKSAGIGGETRG
jgi:hypothetical protein